MNLELSDEQAALRDATARMLDKTSSPGQVRGAEPGGFSPDVWDGLAAMGVPTMGVPSLGGAELADLAVVARQAGEHLAPAPVVEAMVACRLLAAHGRAVDDATVRTIALRSAIDGRLRLIPGGAVAAEVVALDGERLVVVTVGHRTGAEPPAITNLGSAPLADVDLRAAETTVLVDGTAAREAFSCALDEWRALTAQWLVGLARAAFVLGVEYAKERRQFGVPIGSFQAVQHRLADLATALDGAELLADKAVWALDRPTREPGANPSLWPAMAFTMAGETAEAVASVALHLHGGYGFMEEYDIQLHFRRAKAARIVLADPRHELQGLADRLFGPVEAAVS